MNIINYIINFIKNFLKKEQTQVVEEEVTAEMLFRMEKTNEFLKGLCVECPVNSTCKEKHHQHQIPTFLCKFKKNIVLDKAKPTILLMDDNVGIISFLEDDLNYLDKIGIIKLSDYNILKFTTKDAAFEAISNASIYDGYNTVFAILDITLGGSTVDNENKTIVYDGVDVFIELKKHINDFKYIFFTGNKLNPDIRKNYEIIEKFHNFTGDDINNHILFKTSLSREQKREFFSEFFKKGNDVK